MKKLIVFTVLANSKPHNTGDCSGCGSSRQQYWAMRKTGTRCLVEAKERSMPKHVARATAIIGGRSKNMYERGI